MDDIYSAVSSSISSNRKKFRRARQKTLIKNGLLDLTKKKNLRVPSGIETQLAVGEGFLEYLYPGIVIDADSDACPKCSCVLGQDNIIRGWAPCAIKTFSTTCSSCGHKFVPKFSITCTADTFEGSQGKGTTLYCDYLSPWVLLSEIKNIISGPDGIDVIIDPKFREGSGINASLWWNMIVTFSRFKLPYTFLLQGSSSTQLIMPSLEDM